MVGNKPSVDWFYSESSATANSILFSKILQARCTRAGRERGFGAFVHCNSTELSTQGLMPNIQSQKSNVIYVQLNQSKHV